MEKHLFYDEDGKAYEFYVQASFSVNDLDYAALAPVDGDEELYILRMDSDQEGEVVFSGIDDEELKIAQEVYEELMEESLK